MEKRKVIPRDIAFHVISEEPIHRFYENCFRKNIILEIYEVYKSSRLPGLKRGGVLNIVRRKVELNVQQKIF